MNLSRRSWLASTALVAITRPARGDADKTAQACTLGFSTYGMKGLATEKALRVLTDIGYDAVEIIVRSGWDADSAKLGKRRRQALRGQLNQCGLQLRSLMEHVYPNSASAQKTALSRLALAAEAAHDLSPDNPPLIQTVLGPGHFEDRKSELRDRLGQWLDLARKLNAVVAIKPHRGGVVSKPSEAAWLLQQLGAPSQLKMVYDYSHYAFRDLSIRDTVETALPHTVHVAVKDAIKTSNRVEFRLPGSAGTIDFAQIIRRLHGGGYRGDINCEVSGMVWSKTGYDPVAAAKICYRNINRAFVEAGVDRT